MSKPTMTSAQLEAYQRNLRVKKGEAEFANEAEFLADAQQALKNAGFYPRTPAGIAKGNTGLWYVHLNEARGNPTLGDLLLICARTGTCAEIELKNGNAPFSSTEQSILAMRKDITVCRNWLQFTAAVADFFRRREAAKGALTHG